MKKVKYLTDAAMTTAIMIAILLFSHLTGAEIEELFPFLIPIPVAIYTIKYGFRKGLIPFVAISSLSLFHNPIHGLIYITSGNLIGLIYGTCSRHYSHKQINILVAILGSLVTNVLTLVVFSHLLYGYTILEEIQSIVQSFFTRFAIENMALKSVVDAIAVGLIPSIIAILSIVEGLCFYYAVSFLSKRIIEHSTNYSLKFHLKKMPLWIDVVFIALLIFIFISFFNINKVVGIYKVIWLVAINAVAILNLAYIVVSLFFIASVAHKKKKMVIYYISCLFLLFFPLHVLNGLVVSVFYNVNILFAKKTKKDY